MMLLLTWARRHTSASRPPASPVPTTRILYLRLFAGFTSFMSKRCLSQVFSIGPVGLFPSRFTVAPLFGQKTDEYEDGNGAVSQEGQSREHLAECGESGQGPLVVPPESLEEALDPVLQVKEEDHHGSHVEQGDRRVA